MLRQGPDLTAQVAHMPVKEGMSHGVQGTVTFSTGQALLSAACLTPLNPSTAPCSGCQQDPISLGTLRLAVVWPESDPGDVAPGPTR